MTANDRLTPVAGPLPASGAPPALINAFAQVEIFGTTAADTYRIPSTALRSGDIWLAEDGATVARAGATIALSMAAFHS